MVSAPQAMQLAQMVGSGFGTPLDTSPGIPQHWLLELPLRTRKAGSQPAQTATLKEMVAKLLEQQSGDGLKDSAVSLGKKAARVGGDKLIGVASKKAKERLGDNALTGMLVDRAVAVARDGLRKQTGEGKLRDHWEKHRGKYKAAAGLGAAALGAKGLSLPADGAIQTLAESVRAPRQANLRELSSATSDLASGAQDF
jgi:hypothetical protein